MKIIKKIAKITGITIVSLLAFLIVMPYVLPNTISQKIKELANNRLKGEMNFSNASLSFFNHFPSLTVTLHNFSLKGSAPFEKDTLIAGKELSFGIDVTSIFSSRIDINKIYLSEGKINVQVDEKGAANYNVYVAAPVTTTKTDSVSAALRIEKIIIDKTQLLYNDRSLPMMFKAKNLQYEGKGDLSKAIFDLASKISIESADFTYGNRQYVVSKKLQADLITKVNTNSLAFDFQKNDLLINQLPVNFKGSFAFLSNGYDMHFDIASNASELYKVISAMPTEYVHWLEETDVKGTADIGVTLAGKYSVKDSIMPSLTMYMGIRSGFIQHKEAPAPISNLFLNFSAALPALNPEKLQINVDSLFFNVNNDFVSTVIKTEGLSKPYIDATCNAAIDVEKWNRALGLNLFTVKGKLIANAQIKGTYATAVINNGIRKKDTVITSIPTYNVKVDYTNGYFKLNTLPQAFEQIHIRAKANCADSIYTHSNLYIDSIGLQALNNFIKGKLHIKGGKNWQVDAGLNASINLSEIASFYPLDSLQLKGNFLANISSQGTINLNKKQLPTTKAELLLKDGYVKTKYYPSAIENIAVEAIVTDNNGTLKNCKVQLKPISFKFENQPFTLKAQIQNLNDIQYNIASNGTVDLGKIYKVFPYPGIQLQGIIGTNFVLKGLQSDAASGNYDKLFNKGNVSVKQIAITTDMYPFPFYIKSGKISFLQDKMWFDELKATYQKSDFTGKGYITNGFNYVLKNESLKAGFELNSNKLVVDDFMAFASTKVSSGSKNTGVVLLPKNLDLSVKATALKVAYNGLTIQDVAGELTLLNGVMAIKKATLTIAGAKAEMDATYRSFNPSKAFFEYKIAAQNFDIQRAYKEVKLFHDLATSAGYVQGVASLDYQIKGRLNKDMMPVYPSLEGGGTIEVANAKIKGLKLFSAVSKATGRDSIANPTVKKVSIKTSIKNNLITIDPVKMKFLGFRPKFSGQVSFDGDLNLKFRLGLPPLGIFGIPMNITGNQANPKIKLGRGNKNASLKETEDQEPAEAEEHP